MSHFYHQSILTRYTCQKLQLFDARDILKTILVEDCEKGMIIPRLLYLMCFRDKSMTRFNEFSYNVEET
jgi:hypothetical protein